MIYGPAVTRFLAPGHPPEMEKHDLIVLHTMVGTLDSTDRMFLNNGWQGTESHFGIGGMWGRDVQLELEGRIFQWVDTKYQADANLEANSRAISIETADNFPRFAEDIEPWTAKQVLAIVNLVAALCHAHNIPAVLVPDSKPSRRGIAYHRQGIDPFRVSGGEKWSTARGKECPGDARIAQIPGIISAVKHKLEPTVALSKSELQQIAEAVLSAPLITNQSDGAPSSKASLEWFISNLELTQDRQFKILNDKLDELIKAVTK